MGSFVLTTKYETKRDPKLDEADLKLKKTIVAFGDVSDKCFKYATEEDITEFISTVEKQLESGANINQEVSAGPPKVLLSQFVIKGLQKMKNFEDQDKLIKMLVEYKWDLNTVYIDNVGSAHEAECEDQGLERALIFDIMDVIGFISPI